MKWNSRKQGEQAEQQALGYLQKKGLKLIEQNFHSRYGEIDLIMQQGEYVVFVEVRQRSNISHGGGLESISPKKQQRIILTAQSYLQKNNKLYRHPCRFDAIAIDTIERQEKIQWIQDAFQA